MEYYQPGILAESPADQLPSPGRCQANLMFPISLPEGSENMCYGNFEPIGKQRNQANARERDRTQNASKYLTSKYQCRSEGAAGVNCKGKRADTNSSVNSAFGLLRSMIPTEPQDRKLSKIEILRLAGSYINHMANQLYTGIADQPCMQMKSLEISGTRNQVCTFCWSSIKKEKSFASKLQSSSPSSEEISFY